MTAATLPALRNDNIIVRLEAAKVALAHADIKTTKAIADVAAAAEVYAARQKLGEEVEQQAYAIKIDALRRLGELLKASPKNHGKRLNGRDSFGGTRQEPPKNDTPTLAELGVDKKVSSIAQRLAALPEEAFEEVKEGHKTIGQAIAAVGGTKRVPPKTADGANQEPSSPEAEELEALKAKYSDLLEKNDELADVARELNDKLEAFETTELDEQQKLIADLQLKLRRKEAEIDRLRVQIRDANNKNNELIRTVKRLQKHG